MIARLIRTKGRRSHRLRVLDRSTGCEAHKIACRGLRLQRRCRNFLQKKFIELQVPEKIASFLWHTIRVLANRQISSDFKTSGLIQ
jgi:hypothetical protein